MKKEVYINSIFPAYLERQIRIAAATLGINRSEFMRQAAIEKLSKIRPPEIQNREASHERRQPA